MKKQSTNLEKEILKKIKKGDVKIKPKIFFIFKNLFFWLFFVIFIFLGAISFASVLYKVSNDYFLIKKILTNDIGIFENILFTFPIFWFLLLFVFIFLAIKNYKKTKLFYRKNIYLVFSFALLLSFFFGFLFFNFGVAKKTEEFSEKYIPFYNKYLQIQEAKKDIFITKIKQLGITKNILEKNPDIKKKVEEKFDKNVLGKIYLYKIPDACLRENFVCKKSEIFFQDQKGCGCREIHFYLKD